MTPEELGSPLTLSLFRQEVASLFPDNAEGLITPEKLRAAFLLVARLIQEGVDE